MTTAANPFPVAPATIAIPGAISDATAQAGPGHPIRAAVRQVLTIPLFAKILGANALIAMGALGLGLHASAGVQAGLAWGAFVAAMAINALLIRVALLPLDEVERVARSVAEGDIDARVSVLPTADRQAVRLAKSLNDLLARAAEDRARIRHLVRESLRAREMERVSISSHLRDGIAQDLFGLSLTLTAASERTNDPAITEAVGRARDLVRRVSDDVRRTADSVYPGLLGRFGLYTALETLCRRTAGHAGLGVTVDLREHEHPLSLAATTALYGVAEELLRNVEQHAHARNIHVTLSRAGGAIRLTVDDDGMGFDPAGADRHHAGIGLLRARELLAHAGGSLVVTSIPGAGTRAVASVLVEQ